MKQLFWVILAGIAPPIMKADTNLKLSTAKAWSPEKLALLHNDAFFELEKIYKSQEPSRGTDLTKDFQDIFTQFCQPDDSICQTGAKLVSKYRSKDISNSKPSSISSEMNMNPIREYISQIKHVINKSDGIENMLQSIHIIEQEIKKSRFLNDIQKNIGNTITSLTVENTKFWHKVSTDKDHFLNKLTDQTENRELQILSSLQSFDFCFNHRIQSAISAAIDAVSETFDTVLFPFALFIAVFHAVSDSTSAFLNPPSTIVLKNIERHETKLYDGECVTDATIEEDISINGTLELRNVNVSFSSGNGSLTVEEKGFLSLENCTLFENEYCPPKFTQRRNKCYLLTKEKMKEKDAKNICSTFHTRVYLPTISDIDLSELQVIIPGQVKVWIASDEKANCTAIDYNGIPTFYQEENECLVDKNALCVAETKSPITNYGSYQSIKTDQPVLKLYDLFKHLDDKVNVPNIRSEDTTVTMRVENINGEFIPYTVPNAKPVEVKVSVDFVSGQNDDIEVALDPQGSSSTLTWEISEGSNLPSKIQIHALDEVCIKKVDLSISDAPGNSFIVKTINASSFVSCYDFNVCSQQNENDCPRSLMYYNEENDCAVLDPNNPKYPRDFSIELFDLGCTSLTSWTSKDVKVKKQADTGESYILEISESVNPAKPRREAYIFSDVVSASTHTYTFLPSNNSISSVDLVSSSTLPSSFKITNGTGGRLKSFRIKRYNETVYEVDFIKLSGCIKLCNRLVDETGLLFDKVSGVNSTQTSALVENECQKLVLLTTSNITHQGDRDSTEVCTDPNSKNVSTITELKNELDFILNSTSPFRTIKVNIPYDGFDHVNNITIFENRGLVINSQPAPSPVSSQSPSQTSSKSTPSKRKPRSRIAKKKSSFLSGIQFSVQNMSSLTLNNINLNGTTEIEVEPLGNLVVSSTTIDKKYSQPPFIQNKGMLTLSSVKILNKTRLENQGEGQMSIGFAKFKDESTLGLSPNGKLTIYNLDIYDTFPLEGDVIVKNTAKQIYKAVDTSNTLCKGNDVPNVTLEVTPDKCSNECDAQYVCSGAWSYLDDNSTYQCGLCLLEDEQCSFNCSVPHSTYNLPESNFNYTIASGCSLGANEFNNLLNLTLEECTSICTYYESCDGFNYVFDESGSNCKVVTSLDLEATDCDETKRQNFYIPYNRTHHGNFLQIQGEFAAVENITMLQKYENKDEFECSAICMSTIGCLSYVIEGKQCQLYDKRKFEIKDTTSKLFIYARDIYPVNRYMKYINMVPTANPIRSFVTKSESKCQRQCNQDKACATFTFTPFFSSSETNCRLFDGSSDFTQGDTDSTYVRYSSDTYVQSSGSVFIGEKNISDISSNECKTFCLYDIDCVAYKYTFSGNQKSSICEVGILGDVKVTSSPSLEVSSFPSLAPSVVLTRGGEKIIAGK